MSKRTFVALVIVLGVVFCVKGVIAKPHTDVPAYKVYQQDQGVQAYKGSNVSKI